MSIQDERELRGRLGGLLDSVEAAPAPVASAMRRGRVIRMRRWVSAAAGVAVLAAGAVVLTGLIQGHRAVPPAAPRHYTVTVQSLGPTAKSGLVGTGTINNKRWRVVLDTIQGDGCSPMPYVLTCGSTFYGSPVGPREVSFNAAAANDTQYQLGIVGADVTRVVIRLSNGTELSVRPVSAYGHRWVAVAAPIHAMVGAVSFVGGSEYRHSVPYVTSTYAEFVTWLRPGEPGLTRASGLLGSGEIAGAKWRISVQAGPWGYCVTFAAGGTCGAGPPQAPRIGKPLAFDACTQLSTSAGKQVTAFSGDVVIPAGVKNLVLKFADGSRLRLVGVTVGGARIIGYGLPNRPKVVRMLEYGFAGQLVGSLPGAGWRC